MSTGVLTLENLAKIVVLRWFFCTNWRHYVLIKLKFGVEVYTISLLLYANLGLVPVLLQLGDGYSSHFQHGVILGMMPSLMTSLSAAFRLHVNVGILPVLPQRADAYGF